MDGGDHEGERLVVAEMMHDWWCKQRVAGRLDTTPCLHHQFMQKSKSVCTDEENPSAECTQLVDEHEKNMAARENGERDREQAREMHDAWCGMPENAAHDFCKGWFEFKSNGDVDGDVEDVQAAEAMHDWWCKQKLGRGTTPCLHHQFIQKRKVVCGDSSEESPSAACMQLVEEHEKQIEARGQGTGEEEASRMHDAWCALPANVASDFCKGWEEWKARQESGQDREL